MIMGKLTLKMDFIDSIGSNNSDNSFGIKFVTYPHRNNKSQSLMLKMIINLQVSYLFSLIIMINSASKDA